MTKDKRMQYSAKDYEFLGRQVASGRYVARSTLLLSLVLALLAGVCLGRYLFPDMGGMTAGSTEQKRPLDRNSNIAAAMDPKKQIFDSILQHEEDVRRDPKNAEAWEHLGNLYYDADEPAKSVNAYLKAIELNPTNADIMVNCGVAYRQLKQFDKALEFFQKALAVNPKQEYALFNSGIVLYHDLDRKEEAMETWRALVKIHPNAKTPTGELVTDMIKNH